LKLPALYPFELFGIRNPPTYWRLDWYTSGNCVFVELPLAVAKDQVYEPAMVLPAESLTPLMVAV
jgi:hypothetical protein